LLAIDKLFRDLDGTDNFSNIGGNPTVAVSMAVAKAAALDRNVPLWKYLNKILNKFLNKEFTVNSVVTRPLGNVLGGGAHAVGGTDIQEFLVCSQGETAEASVFANTQVHKKVKEKLKSRFPNSAIGKGDEGGWVAHVTDEEALTLVKSACDEVSADAGFEIRANLDMAASELYNRDSGCYEYKNTGDRLDTDSQIDFVIELIKNYGLYYVEDPLDQNDFEGYAKLTKKISKIKNCLICGDDLFVTNEKRLKKGISAGACNSILIKPNQIGTMSDTLKTVALALNNNYVPVVSHRSGETTDETIAHLAVAAGAPMIKTGVVGGERIAKLNELIRIEESM
jgi:enolase